MNTTHYPTAVASGLVLMALTGCASQTATSPPVTGIAGHKTGPATTTDYARQALHGFYKVLGTEFDRHTGTVTIHSRNLVHGPLTPSAFRRIGGETTLDAASLNGIINFGTAEYPSQNVRHVRLLDHRSGWRYRGNRGWHGTVRSGSTAAGNQVGNHSARAVGGAGTADSGGATTVASLPVPASMGAAASHGTTGSYPYQPPGAATAGGSIPIPPPGVRIDTNVSPMAGAGASRTAKVAAVEQIAQSKLGTPYIWGHNEDRGQYGFDCSNYTEYVYHHSLGYLFTTSSKGQYLYVGVRVNTSNMLPGDLVAFDQGGHVGIFVGNGQMIQEGGGLHKAGYLPLYPGSYWYGHISAVKRMF